jgi:hypothetical protein
MYRLKRNPKAVTHYSTKVKSEAGPTHVKMLPTSHPLNAFLTSAVEEDESSDPYVEKEDGISSRRNSA